MFVSHRTMESFFFLKNFRRSMEDELALQTGGPVSMLKIMEGFCRL